MSMKEILGFTLQVFVDMTCVFWIILKEGVLHTEKKKKVVQPIKLYPVPVMRSWGMVQG